MKERNALGKILIATDLSEISARAIDWLPWTRGRPDSIIYVVYVLDLIPGLSTQEIAEARTVAEQRFKRFILKHRLNRKPFVPVLMAGDAALVVKEFVDRHNIALVVLGSQATGINRFFRGSVSEEVFRSVDCPVVTVGPRVTTRRGTLGRRRVLFATNLAKKSESVLVRLRVLLSSYSHSRLALAHFLRKESKSVVERHTTRKELREKLIELAPAGLRDRIDDVIVESCPPVKGILEFSRSCRADLLVLAVRDAGPFARAATHGARSITRQIIEAAKCPVLTIRIDS
jgi:nucleotide-binding universal stress UspA family protein